MGARMQRVFGHIHASELTHPDIMQGDDDPEEKTSTLVLTSPSGLFVDLRILAHCMPDTGPDDTRERPFSAIDWAFAGRSLRQPARLDGVTEACWTHWVDSRTSDALSVHDTGLCRTLPNGDELEIGVMRDPEGVVRPYEEIWRDKIVTPLRAAVFVCSQNASAIYSASVGDIDTILPHEICGMIVRAGTWFQGVFRDPQLGIDGDQRLFTAERWRLTNDGTWQRIFRTGKYNLPVERLNSASVSTALEDLSFSEGGLYWRCIELYEGETIAKELPS